MTEAININTLSDVIKTFKASIDRRLNENIDISVRSPLTNMLALHFYDKGNNDLKIIAEVCCTRILSFLEKRIILDYEFSVVISLFAIAITEKLNNNNDLIENIFFSADKTTIKNNLEALLKGKIKEDDLIEIVNYILEQKDAHLLINYIADESNDITTSYQHYKKAGMHLSSQQLAREFSDFVRQQALKASQQQDLRQNITLFASIAIGTGMAAVALSGLGIFASILVLPMTYSGLTYGSNITNKISNFISDKLISFTRTESELPSLDFSKLQPQNLASNLQQPKIEKVVSQEAVKIITDLNISELNGCKITQKHTTNEQVKTSSKTERNM